jgi:cleavage and polyadenylation specificity factor subunit 1
MDKDIRLWTRSCPQCQPAKIQRHTKLPVIPLEIPSLRFESIHIDIVGPLPISNTPSTPSATYRYLLTCVDRNTKWAEAFPMQDTTAKSVSYAFLQWISRFGVPLFVITDRGPQFESEFFSELSQLIGFHRLRTSSYHPQSNGQVERFHRTLKTAIIARKENWLLSLPIILFSIRCIPNDSGYSPFQAVTGKTPLLPSSFIPSPPSSNQDFEQFMRKFIAHMRQIDFRSLPAAHFSSSASYVPAELQSCTHVYVRVDRIKRTLEAPYTGPFLVLDRFDRCFKLQISPDKTDMVSIDRIKPAVMPNSTISISPPNVPTTPNVTPSDSDIPPTSSNETSSGSCLLPNPAAASTPPSATPANVRRNPPRKVTFSSKNFVEYF